MTNKTNNTTQQNMQHGPQQNRSEPKNPRRTSSSYFL